MQDRVGRVGALLFVLADGLFWATLFYLVVFHRLYVHDSRVEDYVRRISDWPDVAPAQRVSTAALLITVGLTWLAVVLDAFGRRMLASAASLAACLNVVAVLAWAAGNGLPVTRGRYGQVVHGVGIVLAMHLALVCVFLFVRARRGASAETSPSVRFHPFLLLVGVAAIGYPLVLI